MHSVFLGAQFLFCPATGWVPGIVPGTGILAASHGERE